MGYPFWFLLLLLTCVKITSNNDSHHSNSLSFHFSLLLALETTPNIDDKIYSSTISNQYTDNSIYSILPIETKTNSSLCIIISEWITPLPPQPTIKLVVKTTVTTSSPKVSQDSSNYPSVSNVTASISHDILQGQYTKGYISVKKPPITTPTTQIHSPSITPLNSPLESY